MPNQKMKLIVALMSALSMGSAIAEAGREPHGHHHRFPADVDAFHAVFAPLWHSRPGEERTRKVCDKAGELERLAGEIRSGDAKPLLATMAALKSKCQSGGGAGFDAALFDVHEAFHQVAEPRSVRQGGR